MLVLIDEIVGWRAGLDDLLARFAHRFGRAEPRRQALTYLVGLLSPLASKNGWTLAEAAGDATPDRMQRLLNRSAWDPDAVRDDLFAYVSPVWVVFGRPGSPRLGTIKRKDTLNSAGDYDHLGSDVVDATFPRDGKTVLIATRDGVLELLPACPLCCTFGRLSDQAGAIVTRAHALVLTGVRS